MTTTNPLVTIITVVLNQPHKLESTLKSITSQAYPNKEIIVIDGGSKEPTQKVLKQWQASINKTISEPDNGIYDGMNTGLKFAKGSWVQFINAGDEYADENALGSFLAFANDSVSLIYSDVFLKNNGKIQEKKQSKVYAYGIFTNICHQSILYNLEKIKKLKFDTTYPVSADFDALLRIYYADEQNFSIKIDKPLVVYEQGGFSDQNLGRILDEREVQFKKHIKKTVIQKINLLNLKRQRAKHNKNDKPS